MKSIVFLLSFCCFSVVFSKEITEIKGYAPKYIGKEIEIYEYVDYVSMKEVKIASATVKEDSSFSCSFYLDETKKLLIKSNNNNSFLFAKPGAVYEIYMPDRDPFEPYRPAGNRVSVSFLDLDTTDINYKILQFNQWTDQFVATYYTKGNADSKVFVEKWDKFRAILSEYYKNDTNDLYFSYHRKFTLARIDDLRFLGARNQYEKYDFYLKNTPVSYQNEAYMDYVKHYYDKLLPRTNMETNNKFYLGLLKSSPTLMYNALANEYTLQHNYKLRELIMIKLIGECFYDKEYPQSNLTAVLDSLEKKTLFPYNAEVAKALHYRLTELVSGGKAPFFSLEINGAMKDLPSYSGKHLYVIFLDPTSKNASSLVDLLLPIFQRYQNEVRFLMVINGDANDPKVKQLKDKALWDVAVVGNNHSIYSSYHVATKPMYVLIDRVGYVVTAPALGPEPNGQYDTIDKVFFNIKKAIEEGVGDGR